LLKYKISHYLEHSISVLKPVNNSSHDEYIMKSSGFQIKYKSYFVHSCAIGLSVGGAQVPVVLIVIVIIQIESSDSQIESP